MNSSPDMAVLDDVLGAVETSSTEDARWIQATLGGNVQAFSHLIAKYQGRLFDLACRILKNRSDAEDALQDAFTQAYRHLHNFQNRSKFSTWLYTIVLNNARNRLRKQKILHWSSMDAPINPDRDESPMELRDRSLSMEARTGQKMDIEALQREVRKLAVHYQAAFVMYYFQGLSIKEICEKLGHPEGTVKVYLHRARKLLYNRLKSNSSRQNRVTPSVLTEMPSLAAVAC